MVSAGLVSGSAACLVNSLKAEPAELCMLVALAMHAPLQTQSRMLTCAQLHVYACYRSSGVLVSPIQDTVLLTRERWPRSERLELLQGCAWRRGATSVRA